MDPKMTLNLLTNNLELGFKLTAELPELPLGKQLVQFMQNFC